MAEAFDITKPDQDESIVLDASLAVPVHVYHRHNTAMGFTASIVLISTGQTIATGPMTPVGTTQRYTASLTVPSGDVPNNVPAADNMTVSVQGVPAGSGASQTDSHQFKASRGGSGSGTIMFASVHAPGLKGKTVPVALQLRLDSPVRPGTCSNCDQLNGPTLLVYSHDADFVGCWFSQPIEFCADGSPPGWWMLQTKDAKTWTLELRHKDALVVTYRFTAASEQKVPFPMTLHIVGKGGKECKNWPRTVTVDPAP
jgi:hypothetical protein